MVVSLKRLVVFLILVPVLLTMNGCNFDRYYGKRPFDYGAAKWISEDPFAWFIVNPDSEDHYSPEGEVNVNDQTIQFKLIFVNQTKTVFFCVIKPENMPYNEGYNDGGFDGECTFSPEKLIIKIEPETDTLFNGQYDTITFVRKPAE